MTTPNPPAIRNLIILGSGAAGLTAAIYAARANLKPLLIRGNQPGGQLTITTEVENFPGFADPIQGPWLMEQMEAQARHCGVEIIADHITKAELASANHQSPITNHLLIGQTGTEYRAHSLIIATGASARWLGLPSEQQYNGRGVSACATCDGAFYRNRDVAVVGGGNSALEEALYLANLCTSVTIIHRRGEFRGEKVMQERILNHPKIKVIWHHHVDEILGDPHPVSGGVTGLRLKHADDGTTQEIAVHGVFIAIGHNPNTSLFKDQLNMDATGYLTVQPGTVNTKIPGVFAAGDVADPVYRQAVTAAGMGCMAALDANRYLDHLPQHQATE